MSIGDLVKDSLRRKSAEKTKSPAIDLYGIKDPAVRNALSAIAERLEVGEKSRPNSNVLDKFVRVRDLVDTGMAKVLGVISNSGPGFEYANPVVIDFTRPPAPTGLSAQGAMSNVILSWDEPGFDSYSHTEVWRAAVDDIGQSTLNGTSVAPVYADEVGDGGRFWYWIRFVSATGIKGPFNATAGTYGETSYDPGYLLSMLTVKWTANTAYNSGSYVIPTPAKETGLWYKATGSGTSGSSEPTWPETLGDTVTDGTVTWEAVEAADEYPPFIVGEVGGVPVVVMNNAYIGDASITNAKVGNAAIDTAKIADAAIVEAKMQNLSVSEAKIKDAAIARAKIKDAAINTAKIADAAITFAKIGDAEVDTLKLAGQAVTFPVSSYTAGYTSFGTSDVLAQSVTIETTGAPVLILASASAINPDSGAGGQPAVGATFELKRGSTSLAVYQKVHIVDDYGVSFAANFLDTPPAGTYTYNLYVKDAFGYATGNVGHRSLTSIEVKR